MAESNQRTKIITRCPPDLANELRALVASGQLDISMNQFVIEAVEKALKQAQKSANGGRPFAETTKPRRLRPGPKPKGFRS